MVVTDFNEWIGSAGNTRIFRMLEYRRPGDWTPLEIERKYMDESHYVNNSYEIIQIAEAIKLPDNDILIGYRTVCEWADLENENRIIHYRKLSQIELSYNPEDQKEDSWW